VVFPLEADHLGSPRVMQKPDGSGTAWSWNLLANSASGSNAFGEQAPTGKQSFSLRFPGQFADGNGLSYNYFRDYEAGTGRYVESDPIGLAGGVSTYSYAAGTPIMKIDPKGLMSEQYLYCLLTGDAYACMGPMPGAAPFSCPGCGCVNSQTACYKTCITVPATVGAVIGAVGTIMRTPIAPAACVAVGPYVATAGALTFIAAVSFCYSTCKFNPCSFQE